MKTRMIFIALLMMGGEVYSQNYLDVIRPFRGMSGVAGAENGVMSTGSGGANALLGNPALLSYSDKTVIAADMALTQVKGTSVFNSSIWENPTDRGLVFNSLSYIHPVPVYRGAWVWGFSLQPLHSFSSISQFNDFDPDGDFYYKYTYQETGNLYALTGGTSVMVTMHTSIGFAASYLIGQNSFSKIYEETDPYDLYYFDRFIDSLQFEPHYSGFNARFGLLTELSDVLNLGISVELPTRINVSESSTRDSVEWYDTGESQVYSHEKWSGLEYSLWGPWRLGIGLGFDASPLEASISYRFHSYSTTSLRGDLYDIVTGEDLVDVVDSQIDQYVENVHEYSASLLWSINPLSLSFGASLMNDPLNYRFDNIIRTDIGMAYQFYSGVGFTAAFRNEQWQSDINHTLESGVDRSVEVENNYTKLQFGMNYTF